jgi:hypothetical protein
MWARAAFTIFTSRIWVLGLRGFFLRVFVPINHALVFFVKIIQIRVVMFRRLSVVRSLHRQGGHASQRP